LIDVGNNATIGQAGQSTNTTYYNADGLHLVTAGYAIVAGLVLAALAALP
jgi:lysophospholipase L1-like esterase